MIRPPASYSNPDALHARVARRTPGPRLVGLLVLLSCTMPSPGWGERDLIPRPAVQESEGSNRAAIAGSQTDLMALDQDNWTKPQSAFKWIAMARDIQTPWDTFGRQGWMTDDAYVKPVDPGVSEFSMDTEMFYLVFAVSALDAPSQYRAAWFYMPDGQTASEELVGTDALLMEMNEKAGYLEIFRPEDGWKQGRYLIKLYFESPGQDLYDPNAIGTMTFTIVE
ncbi:MAG: hypothetical protein OXU40_07090 [Nitrospira sp.]|nr:hypothetical protein [Nitrospira sp.]